MKLSSIVTTFSVAFVLGSVSMLACNAEASPPLPTGDRLRALAPRGFYMGTAVDVAPLEPDASYSTVLAREYNLGMAENAGKMADLEPERGVFDFGPEDEIVKFAQDHGMKMQGGPLVWAGSIPPWVNPGDAGTSDELKSIMTTYITTVMRHYHEKFPGVITLWEVVNEETSAHTGPRVWGRIDPADSGGNPDYVPSYVKLAFETARAAVPDAGLQLFYNDYGYEEGKGPVNSVYAIVKTLREAGLIDGVGMQCHFGAPVDGGAIASTMDRFASLGVQVFVTEFDYRVATDDAGLPKDQSELTAQATAYRNVLSACAATCGCTQFVTWGFTDAHSWIPSTFHGTGAALPFDTGYAAKPAYYALQSVLEDFPPRCIDAGADTGGRATDAAADAKPTVDAASETGFVGSDAGVHPRKDAAIDATTTTSDAASAAKDASKDRGRPADATTTASDAVSAAKDASTDARGAVDAAGSASGGCSCRQSRNGNGEARTFVLGLLLVAAKGRKRRPLR